MAKTSAKANPVNQDVGDRNRGSEPGQEQKSERHDRQNMGIGLGTRVSATSQGKTSRDHGPRHTKTEKGDSRRISKR